jgi:hypothetical protein
MAPPLTKPRLATINPHEVAQEVTTRALRELEELTKALFSPALTLAPANPDLELDARVRKTRLYRSIRRLAEYAQQGTELERPLRDYVALLLPVVQRQLGNGAKASLPDPPAHPAPVDALLARIDLLGEEDPLAIILRGAHARHRLDHTDEALTASQLAVIASEARTRMSKLINEGHPHGKKARTGPARDQKRDNPYLVEQDEARRFLLERGVPGITAPRRR